MYTEKIYDITNAENSLKTLVNLTDGGEEVFKHYIHRVKYLSGNIEECFNEMMNNFNIQPIFEMDDILYNLQHITTSSENCKHIKEKGLMDLRNTYIDTQSELYQFLNENSIKIDISERKLYFNNSEIGDISYENGISVHDYHSKEHKLRMVGYKFYRDFCICGFLSFDHKIPYGGNVHRRPEILFNIAQLIGKRIDNIWEEKHKCYVVKFSVPYRNTISMYIKNKRDLLYYAFNNAIIETDDMEVLLKDNIQVPPEDIISIDRFDFL